jgi:LSD1 subclass zinc finger protein
MEEAKAQAENPAETSAHEENPAAGQLVIHRVCEACNNMFSTHPGSKHQRCPKCTKD